MMRSVWAVLAGFIFIGILAFGSDAIIRAMSPWAFDASGGTSHLAILLVMMLYSSVYGMVGCYIAARLAPSNPMKHALVLGLIGVIISGLMAAQMWSHFPAWFHVINVALVLPLAWLGGRLREKEIGARTAPAGAGPLTA